jgi:hypothetical protein
LGLCVYEYEDGDIAQAAVRAEEALKLLKHHATEICDYRSEWICDRVKFFDGCNLCPACNDKKLYELEQAAIANKLCIKRNMLMYGDGYTLSDDCGREAISIGSSGSNCDECPSYDDLFELFGEYESAKEKEAFLAAENVAKKAAKKIRYIQAMNRLF